MAKNIEQTLDIRSLIVLGKPISVYDPTSLSRGSHAYESLAKEIISIVSNP